MPEFPNHQAAVRYYEVCIKNLQRDIGERVYALGITFDDPKLICMFQRMAVFVETLEHNKRMLLGGNIK